MSNSIKRVSIDICRLVKSPFNVRRTDPSEEYLNELAESIKRSGLQYLPKAHEPFGDLDRDKLYIYDGWDRVLACRKLGMKYIEVEVTDCKNPYMLICKSLDANEKHRQLKPSEIAQAYKNAYLMWINEYRKDIGNYEDRVTVAQSYEKSIYGKDKSVHRFSDFIGKPYRTIARYLKISDLNDEVLVLLDNGFLDILTCEALVDLPEDRRMEFIDYVRAEFISKNRSLTRDIAYSAAMLIKQRRDITVSQAFKLAEERGLIERLKLDRYGGYQANIIDVIRKFKSDERMAREFVEKLELIRGCSEDLFKYIVGDRRNLETLYIANVDAIKYFIGKMDRVKGIFSGFDVNFNEVLKEVYYNTFVNTVDDIRSLNEDLVDIRTGEILREIRSRLEVERGEREEVIRKYGDVCDELKTIILMISRCVDINRLNQFISKLDEYLSRLDEFPTIGTVIRECVDEIDSYYMLFGRYIPFRRYFDRTTKLFKCHLMDIRRASTREDFERYMRNIINVLRRISRILSDEEIMSIALNVLCKLRDRLEEYKVDPKNMDLEGVEEAFNKLSVLKKIAKHYMAFLECEVDDEPMHMFYEMLDYICMLRMDEHVNAERISAVRGIIIGFLQHLDRAIDKLSTAGLAGMIESFKNDFDEDRPGYIHRFIHRYYKIQYDYADLLNEEFMRRLEEIAKYGDYRELENLEHELAMLSEDSRGRGVIIREFKQNFLQIPVNCSYSDIRDIEVIVNVYGGVEGEYYHEVRVDGRQIPVKIVVKRVPMIYEKYDREEQRELSDKLRKAAFDIYRRAFKRALNSSN